MDEPLAGVDAVTEKAIIELLCELKNQGKTLLVVHHDLSTAKTYFDQLILLNMRLIASGEVEKTFTRDLLQKTYGGRLTIFTEVADQSAGVREYEKETESS
jgi:manganese/zinc/iron transport system ATP- binding protein